MHRVQLSDFEGPLDLLLFFIRRDEIDVYDIPIARIADEYLATVRLMHAIDLDAAADFVYTAALLIQIKARMLLPREAPADGEEAVDARAELVERLLEYVRYREAAEHLAVKKDDRERRFTRGDASRPDTALSESVEPTYRVSIFDLIGALGQVIQRASERDPASHAVEAEPIAVAQQRTWLLGRLGDESVRFVELVDGATKPFVIATFLAMLELVQGQRVRLVLGLTPSDFALALAEPAHADSPEALAA